MRVGERESEKERKKVAVTVQLTSKPLVAGAIFLPTESGGQDRWKLEGYLTKTSFPLGHLPSAILGKISLPGLGL